MKIQQFNGGQSSRQRPQYIGQNEAVSYLNIDNALGTLAPVKDKLATAINVQQYHEFFIAEQTWLDAAVPTDFLEFQQSMYLTDGVTAPRKHKNGAYSNLGIVAPAVKPTITNTNAIEPLTDLRMTNLVSLVGTYGDLPLADLRYRIISVKAGRYSDALEVIAKSSTTTLLKTRTLFKGRAAVTSEAVQAIIGNPDGGYDRSIKFDRFKGQRADSVKIFRYYSGIWRELVEINIPGIGLPSPYFDDVADVSAKAEMDIELMSVFEGTYQYVYTNYNNTDGTESAPSPVSDELVAEAGSITITGMEVSTDPQVTHKRLYRVGNDVAQFTLVIQLDTAITSFVDNLDDTDLDGRLLESDNYYEAPTGLKYLSESFAMLFGAVGNSLRFTPIGRPNAWPPEYSLAFDATITGIGPVANGILVFTKYRTFLVTGTGPLSLAQQPLRGDQGCISHASIQRIGPALIWASVEGLCMSAGNDAKLITQDKLGKIALDPVDSEIDDEVYYCHNADGTTLAADFRYGTIFKYLTLGIKTVAYANGDLYGWDADVLYKLFKSDTDLPIEYLSPRFIEGSVTEEKTYKKVHIYSKGVIILNIIINDVTVATRSLSGEGDTQIQVPQDKQRGNFIQFNITGTGEVYEYEYVAGRERNE